MKQLTNSILKFNFHGLDLSKVSKIEFAFSQNLDSKPLKTSEYPSENVTKMTDNSIAVMWTAEETALFEADRCFYADTRITLSDSDAQPETPIVKLRMKPTLFEK